MAYKIHLLRKMIKEELIAEIRKRDMEIVKLKKEVKTQSKRWFNYYRDRAWEKDNPQKAKEYAKRRKILENG